VTVVRWPVELPCGVLLGSLQTGPRGSRLSTAPDYGQAKLRRRGPKIVPVSCIIAVSPDLRARFDRFWDEDTAGGTLPFLYRDQQLDGYQLADESGAWLETEDGSPIRMESWWLVQFDKQEPAYSRLSGNKFQIQFSIVVLP
jgi:hypothetical protein